MYFVLAMGRLGLGSNGSLCLRPFLGYTLHFDLAVWVKAKYVVEPRVDWVPG